MLNIWRSKANATDQFGQARASQWVSDWLGLAILIFGCSYLLDIPSKASNTIFYTLFGLPVFFHISARAIRDKGISPPSGMLPITVFLGLSILAETLSVEGAPLQILKQSTYLLVLYIGVALISSRAARLRLCLVIFGVASLVYFSLPIYEWVLAYATTGISKRIQSYDLNLSRSSLLIAFGILSLWLFLLEPWLTKMRRPLLTTAAFSGVVMVVGFAALVFQSRSTLISLFLFLICYGVMYSRYRQVLVIVLGLAAVALLAGVYDVLSERGTSFRGVIWQDALARIGRDCSWLTGCGSGGGYLFAGQFQNAHSGFVATVYHHGVPSLIALFALMYQVFSKGIKEKSPYLLLSTVGWGGAIASSAGFIDSPQPQWIYLWIPAFLTLSSNQDDSYSPR